MARKKKQAEQTFTKKLVVVMLIVGVLNAEIPFILSAFGRDPVVDIGRLWITQIIAVIVGYYVKSYFGKKAEEDTRLKETYVYGGSAAEDDGLDFEDLNDDVAQG
jgi:hypothetical protein